MFRVTYISVIIIILIFSLVQCNKPYEIDQENVERLIKKISADEMKGRHAFSPEIELAAAFIANEFGNIGISPLPGQSDFLQRFTVYTISPTDIQISINGKSVDESRYFGFFNSKKIEWPDAEVSKKIISADDKFRQTVGDIIDDDESSFILVDYSHKKLFHRYQRYFSRHNRTVSLNEAPTDIFVLSDQSEKSYQVKVLNTIKETELSNVGGMIEGRRKDEIILFSAHYDHIGVISSAEGDSIANGANDNASGTAAIIELARYYNSRPTPERTLYFVAFTAEEAGGFGSKYLANQIDPEQIIAMFNIEMIGKPSVQDPKSAWITGYNRSTLGEILANNADESFSFYPDPYPQQNLFWRSDNATFARYGVPAHSISTTPIDVDRNYHTISDDYKTINTLHTSKTIKAIGKVAQVIISGQETPTRIKLDAEN